MTGRDDLQATFFQEFASVCGMLSRIGALPAGNREALRPIFARYEDVALDLLSRDAMKRDRDTWLRHAIGTTSLRLIEAFGPAPANSTTPDLGKVNREAVINHTHADYLEALHAAGVDLSDEHGRIMERALLAGRTDLQSFLERRFKTVWTHEILLPRTEVICAHAGFLARYLKATQKRYPKFFEDWNARAMRGSRGRDMLIYEALGVGVGPNKFIPDAQLNAFRNLSAHRRMQIEGWKRNIESLLADKAALDWADRHLLPGS